MSTATQPRHLHQRRTEELLTALEQHGLLDPARHEEAADIIDRSGGDRAAESATLRRVLAEVAGYVGAAFVVAAVAVFFAPRWLDIPVAGRIGLLTGTAVVLAGAGFVLGITGGGLHSLRTVEGALRRRLASVLFTGAAVAGAAAVVVYLTDRIGDQEPTQGSYIGMGGALTLVLLASIGYALAPTLLGQAAVAIGAAYGVVFTLDSFGDVRSLGVGLSYLAVGVLWLAMAEVRIWREQLPARLIGSAFVLVGAQALMGDYAWLSYTTTLLVGVAGFVLYVARHAWPYLALGVVAVTLAVPEALLDWTQGSLGTAAALLAAGITLLLASLVGLRLRREVAEDRAQPAD